MATLSRLRRRAPRRSNPTTDSRRLQDAALGRGAGCLRGALSKRGLEDRGTAFPGADPARTGGAWRVRRARRYAAAGPRPAPRPGAVGGRRHGAAAGTGWSCLPAIVPDGRGPDGDPGRRAFPTRGPGGSGRSGDRGLVVSTATLSPCCFLAERG